MKSTSKFSDWLGEVSEASFTLLQPTLICNRWIILSQGDICKRYKNNWSQDMTYWENDGDET